MPRKLLMLRSPSLMYNYSGIPPFGLATITAELKSKGFDIVQDDLDAKCAADELFPEPGGIPLPQCRSSGGQECGGMLIKFRGFGIDRQECVQIPGIVGV